jgi:hypothetical protein
VVILAIRILFVITIYLNIIYLTFVLYDFGIVSKISTFLSVRDS